MTSWRFWMELEPNTDVVYASENMRYREHGAASRGIAHPDLLEGAGANLDDRRFPTNELVYGIECDQRSKGLAIPLRALRQVHHIEIVYEDLPILIYQRGDYQVLAYVRKLGNSALTFEPVNGDFFKFRDQSGTVWNYWGKAESGVHKGKALKPARGYMTEWYEWVSICPDTLIYSP